MAQHPASTRPWAMCTVARSGSTWFCDLISSTGILGRPMEYLLHVHSWYRRFGLPADTSLDDYFAYLMENTSSSNGAFGVKGGLEQLRPFFARFGDTPCVWLRRKNLLEQAISWYRAEVSGIWHLRQGQPSPQPSPFNRSEILRFLEIIRQRRDAWVSWFAEQGIMPLELTYEQVCADPLGAIRAVAQHVGVSHCSIQHVNSAHRVVRDNSTVSWLKLLTDVPVE